MGIMTTIFVIIITSMFIAIMGFGAQGRSEDREAMEAGAADRNHTGGRGRVEPIPQGTTGGGRGGGGGCTIHAVTAFPRIHT